MKSWGRGEGVKIDHELNFNKHVSSLCKKASQKLNALSRIASCVKFDQRRLILNSIITSHFSYCLVVWMFHSRKLNGRINHIHERALRIIYKDYNSSFQELLIEDKSLNIHHRNLQKLVTEIFKVKNGLSPELMNDAYRKTILPTKNFAFQVEEDPYSKLWHRNTSLPWLQIMERCSKMNIKLLNRLQILRQKQNKDLDPRELSLQVMQNIYSP